MNLAYNTLNQTEPSRIYVCRPHGETLYELNSIQPNSVSMTLNLNNISELEFTIDRYIDINGEFVEGNGYNSLDKFMEVYVEGYGKFISGSPSYSNDGNKETKTINCESLESELQNKYLVGFKINKGTKDSMEYLAKNNINGSGSAIKYVTFYNEDNPELSLLDLVLADKCKDWSIGYIDPELKGKKFSFEVDSQDIYSFLTTVLAKDAECVFYFDTINRVINAVYKDNIGENTNVVIGFRNLVNSVKQDVVNESDIATRFYVQGSDDLQIIYANFGTNYIDNIDYYLNDNFFNEDTITKYKQWLAYRESKRNNYIEKSKEYNKLNDEYLAIKYKLPIDGCEFNQWDNCDIEILRNSYAYYESLIMAFRSQVETDNGETVNNVVVSDANINAMTTLVDNYLEALKTGTESQANSYLASINTYANLYKVSKWYIIYQYASDSYKPKEIFNPSHLKSGIPDDEFYMSKLDVTNSGYYTYYETITYIMPNIQIAINNYYLADDDKTDFNDGYEYEWDLYGTVELKAQIQKLNEKLKPLSDYSKPWSKLTAEEKSKVPVGEESYTSYHNQYQEIYDHIYGTSNVIGAKQALTTRESELLLKETELNSINNERTVIAKSVSLGLSCKGLTENEEEVDLTFTEEEYFRINSLYKESTYTNDTIVATSILTSEQLVDKQKELYDDAVEKLSEYSQPQYHFDSTINNLFGIPEFKSWHGDIALGNFIRLNANDEHSVKLRIISIALNPMDYSSDITLTFSDMIKGYRDRNDFTALFDNASGGTGGSISVGSNSNSDLSLSTEVLTLIANSGIMNGKFNNLTNQILASNEGVFGTINTDYISSELAKFDEEQVKKLTADTAFVKYLNANLITADALVAAIANITEADIGTLWADTAFIEYIQANAVSVDTIQSIVSTSVESTVDTAFIKSLIAGDIYSLSDSTGMLTIGDDEDGKIIANGSTMQFKDADGNTYIQLGTDESGGHSLIVKDSNGTVLLNGGGITKDAITDGLIVDEMVKKKDANYNGISSDALNIDSVVTSINNGTSTIKSSQIYFDEDNQTLNTKLESMTTSISQEIDNKLAYTVTIYSSSGNIFKGTTSSTMKAIVKKGNDEIDTEGTLYTYTWSKYNAAGVKDTSWSKLGKTITITDTEISEKAIFNVEVNEI